jgi:SWI/SNF-related matrix-associated actin-dependent regulator 1 of chromatin subfamily A
MTMKVFQNAYKSKCQSCGTTLAPKSGFVVQMNGAYKGCCNSTACIGQAPQAVQNAIYAFASPKMEITSQGLITMPYNPDALPILRGMPGARWNGAQWQVSTEAKDRKRVVEGCKRLGLQMPEGFDVVEESNLVSQAIQRAQSAGAYSYQLEGVRFLSERDNALLADDMGLGKTFQSLNAVEGRAIVVCPATLKANWASEVKKWRSDLTPVVCKGRKGFKLPSEGEVVIINYDILPTEFTPTDKWGEDSENVSPAWREVLAKTTLIADEAHLCKSHKATRSKRTKVLSYLCGKSWAMTGTPLLSKGFDLWGVVSTFGMGREMFGGFKGFVRDMNAYQNTWGGWEFGTPDASVAEKLRRAMLRRTKSEVLTSLPPKTYQDVLCEITSKKLLKMTEKAMERLKALDGELPPFEEFSGLRAELAESRIPALLEMVESFEEAEEPVVVFSAHRAPIEALEGREGWKIIMGDTPHDEREMAVNLFQAGVLKGIACTIKAGGVGITLTKASKMIFCDLEWTPALNAQAEDRICRIGQTASNLQYIRLVSDCAMDIHVLNLLDKKKALIEASIEREVGAVSSETSKIEIREETPEEAKKRAQEESEAQATEKVLQNLPQYASRARALPPVDLMTQAEILQGVHTLLSVCDGAQAQDSRGFNKPDSLTMKEIWRSGLLRDLAQQDLLRFAWTTLLKYRGQIQSVTPSLF